MNLVCPRLFRKPPWIAEIQLLSAALVLLMGSPSLSQTIPYRTLSEAGAGFFGPGREEKEPESLGSVRIGLTGPANSPEGMHLQQGTLLAFEEANTQGGYRGLPYELVFRPNDGPWGVEAKQVVRLAYEDEVWAILGALNGRQAHLAELVSAKAWIPIVTPSASDVTIDYANVPWVFRCMPDDSSQAEALVRFAKQRGYRRLYVLSEAERESHLGWERLAEVSRRERFPFALHLEYDPLQPEAIVPRFQNDVIDALIIWGSPQSSVLFLRALQKTGINVPVLGPSHLATPFFVKEVSYPGKIIVAAPFDLSLDIPKISRFHERYLAFAGFPPSPAAFYAYDATRMVIKAIEQGGLNRSRLRDALASMSYDGLTGKIQFNSLGGNQTKPVLLSLRAGKWFRLEY